MKKVVLMGFAAAAMLASCSNDETVDMAQQNNAIGFSSFVNKSTRATAADDITLANLGSIEVYGWRGDDMIFNAQAVTVDVSGNGTYTPVQYWEANYTYAFEAIAPKNGESGVTFAAAKAGGTISFENNAETDLVYSKASDVTTPASITTSPGVVNFTFGHMLSRVKFTFVNGFPEDAVAKISVSDVKITNAYRHGTITPTADADAGWTVDDNTLEVLFANVDATDIAAGEQSGETEHMYLIPATSPAYTVTFSVTLDQAGVKSTYEHTSTITTSMAKGLSYNFIATLDETNIADDPLFPIEFSADITPWEEFGNVDLSVE